MKKTTVTGYHLRKPDQLFPATLISATACCSVINSACEMRVLRTRERSFHHPRTCNYFIFNADKN